MFQLAGKVVCFIAWLLLKILLVSTELLIIAVVTLLLATVIFKGFPMTEKGTTLGTEEVSFLELS